MAAISASLITTSLKYSVQRERPFVTYNDIQKRDVGGSPSFPSGHTSSAFALATSLSLHWRKWYVVVPSYIWATGVGYGRMYQGVHYPTDVLAGAIIGSGMAYLSYKFQQRLTKNKVRYFGK
jgi:membrane-associated phospholipid phosphatase